MKYRLQRYTGRASRHKCPKCGRKGCFTLYVDDSLVSVNERVGRCDHESSCGYHYTPREYFADNNIYNNSSNIADRGEYRARNSGRSMFNRSEGLNTLNRLNTPTQKPDLLSWDYVARSESLQSVFAEWLLTLCDRRSVERVAHEYYLGATKSRKVIYWQIDKEGGVRSGKVMAYRSDGHRDRDVLPFWTHGALKCEHIIPQDFNLVQCLFGEHLLARYPARRVALVESEKSALLCSLTMPDYIWLATGGKSQLAENKMQVLAGRDVVMFPDVDGYEEWAERSKDFTFANFVVSDLLELNATPEERARKIDIGDWIVSHLQSKCTAT